MFSHCFSLFLPYFLHSVVEGSWRRSIVGCMGGKGTIRGKSSLPVLYKYVFSLFSFIFALFFASCGGGKLAARYCCMYMRKRYYRGKKFVTYFK